MKKFLQEFKDFAVKGNVVDLAVAVIIGGAFGKIVSSLVADVIMPPLGLIMEEGNLADRKWVLRAATDNRSEIVMNIGAFLQNVLDFILIALVIFLLVKAISVLKDKVKKEKLPEAPQKAPLTKDQELLMEIRDLLKPEDKR